MRHFGRSFRALNLLLSALLFSSGLAQAQSNEPVHSLDNHTRYTALAEQARSEGSVRIIIQLSERSVNEAALSAPAAHIDPRIHGISVVQQKFLDELAVRDKRLEGRRFTYIPFISLRVDNEVLDAAMKSPYIEAVFEDEIYASQIGENTEIIGADAAWENGGLRRRSGSGHH